MNPRLIASLAIGAALVLGTTGCSMVSPQATTINYAAAEGVNVFESGPVQVRNAQIVADESGSEGNFVAALLNETDESHTLRIEFGEGSSRVSVDVRVPANTTLSLGSEDGEEPILVEDLDTPPGADVVAFFQSGDSEGELTSVPVLDGTLDYLAPLAP
ncbi:DNA modification methylase [Microbacterium sp. CPCC 204701]|uniref:DNA modification methylase n=1 Tax=Microbacterium sp. CPCC 204701 TaxID=2493084 RepID=UPI000FDA2E50|nr:DNA modification methylase [Microbacterium sp. CPCC 204701]